MLIIYAGSGLDLALHEPAIKFLLLFQRFFTSLDGNSDVLKHVVMQHVCQLLEGFLKTFDLQIISKVAYCLCIC